MNWSQLRTVLWLRWRLTRNQWSRRGGVLSAVLTILALVMGSVIALAALVGGAAAGALGLGKAPPELLLIVWDVIIGVFLLLWLIGVLTEIQRSETIDLGRLLHLPVSLQGIFLVNYLASHLTLSIVVFLPGALGLCAGLAWARGWAMLLLIPQVLGFVFMATAWTYCLRGWLVSLMVNPRKRRSILTGATLVVILLAQLPNLYFNVIAGPDRRHFHSSNPPPTNPVPGEGKSTDNPGGYPFLPPAFLAAHTYAPPLWVANTAVGLAKGHVWPAIWGSLAALAIGAAGLGRAYRSTLRFYRGQETSAPAKKRAAAPGHAVRGSSLLERRLSAVPEEPAALALALFRSLTRAPEVKMALASNLVVLVVLAVMFSSRGAQAPGDLVKPFLAAGVVGSTFFGLLQLMFNQFGFDRDGFRALVLLPIQRKHTLLAKNLSLVPIAFGLGLLFLAILQVIAGLHWLVLVAACLQLTAMFLLLSLAGNFVSIIAPYRIALGSLKPTKASGKTTLFIFISHICFPLLLTPIFIPPALGLVAGSLGWLPATTVNALASLLLAALVALIYRLSLAALGDLLQQREKEILQIVSQEVE